MPSNLSTSVVPERFTLRRLVRTLLAGGEVPRAIQFVADLPRPATGQLERCRLRG